MPKVHGILETALYVDDIARSASFYKELFGFNSIFESKRLIALDVAGRDILLLFTKETTKSPFQVQGGLIPPHGDGGQTHFAFSIDKEELENRRTHLAEHNVEVESTVQWLQGGVSLYFRDPDHNLAELITPGFWSTY